MYWLYTSYIELYILQLSYLNKRIWRMICLNKLIEIDVVFDGDFLNEKLRP